MILVIIPFVDALEGEAIHQELENVSQVRILVMVEQGQQAEGGGFLFFKPSKGPYERFMDQMRPSPITALVSMLSDDEPYAVVSKVESIGGVVMDVNKKGLDMVLDNPYTKGAFSNKDVHLLLEESGSLIGIDTISSTPYKGNRINGSGNSVCVIDTGVDRDHPALQGKVVAEKCFCYPDCCPNGKDIDDDASDDNGHGTHVAGVIASGDNSERGLSQDASIVAVKTLDANGTGDFIDTILAIEWCSNITNRDAYNISIISMSLGEGIYEGSCDGANTYGLANASNAAAESGIFVVAATGNDASEAGIATPACASKVFSVGATYDRDIPKQNYSTCSDSDPTTDSLTCFTNIDTSESDHPAPDLLAPGAAITSPVPVDTCTGSPDLSHCDPSGFNTLAGTSMATPHVAAAASMFIEMHVLTHGRRPTPTEIAEGLRDSSYLVNTPRAGIQFPRLDLNTSILGLETDPPEITLVDPTPSEGENITDIPITINTTIYDAMHQVDTCVFEWVNPDGITQQEKMNHSDTCTLSFMPDGTGNITFTVIANDTVGNIAETDPRTITVSNAAPTINSFSPGEISLTMAENTSQSFSITATDDNGDPLIATAYLDNETMVSESLDTDTFAWNIQANWTMAGTYDMRVVVTDGGLEDTWSWDLNITDVDAPLEHIQPISDVWWYDRPNRYKNISVVNISTHINDIDGDMECVIVTHDNVTANITGNTLILSSSKNWTGLTNVTLTCNDSVSIVNDTFHAWVTRDFDTDGHEPSVLGGDDCDDSNPVKWTGRKCDRDCYDGSRYDERCSCTGGTYTCDNDDDDDGGGSSGGGAPIITRPTSTAYYDSLDEGSTYQRIVDEPSIPVKDYEFTLVKDQYSVSVRIERITVPGAYAGFEVDHSFDEDTISEARIRFRANKSYASQYHHISLFRLEQNGWHELETRQTIEEQEAFVYEAISPGFSRFMIKGVGEPDAKEPSVNHTQTDITNMTGNNSQKNDMVPTHTRGTGNRTNNTSNASEIVVSPHKDTPSYIVVSPMRLIGWGAIVFVSALVVTLFVLHPERSYNPRALERYISHRLSIGHDEERIREDLNELGWKEDHIRKHTEHAKILHKFSKLEEYIERRLMLGHIEDDIEKELHEYGWHPHHVQRAKSRVKRKFSKNLDETVDDKQH